MFQSNMQTFIGIAVALAGGIGLAWPKIKAFLPSKKTVTVDQPPFDAVIQLRDYFVLVGNAEGEAAAALCGRELFTIPPERPK